MFTLTLTILLSHSFTLSVHSHTLTLSLSHSLTLYMLNNFCFHVYAEKSHSHTLFLSHYHTLSFTLSRHAEQLLFSCLGSIVTVYCLQPIIWGFFYIHIIHITLTCYFRCHRAGSQLKTSKIVTSSISRAGPLYRYWPVIGCSQTSGYLPISSPV